MKKILITGAGSYIGEAVNGYLQQNPEKYTIDIIDTREYDPKPDDYKGYDVVFNVAGIAHIKETPENRDLYFRVNRDLSIKIAKAAKAAGVKQFILLSSMSVYGKLTGHITKKTKEKPINAYGMSKAQADHAIAKLVDQNFRFACLRPPMVYGKGCKGNYQSLRAFALKSPVFPDYENQRSMIYIGNLCEFVKRIIDKQVGGLFFPQNAEYVKTSELVKSISEENSHSIRLTSAFDPFINYFPINVTKKVFGSLTYEKVDAVDKYSFLESVRLTEGSMRDYSICAHTTSSNNNGKSDEPVFLTKEVTDSDCSKKVKIHPQRVAVISSHTPSFFWYRMDMMEEFVRRGHQVFALGNESEEEWREKFLEYGITYRQIDIERNGTNPLHDLKTISSIKKTLSDIKPDKIFTYQAKSTIYGGISANLNGLRGVYPMIGGIGSVYINNDFKTKAIRAVMTTEYKLALCNSQFVFFQNTDDEEIFRQQGIVRDQKVVRLAGSGVNSQKFMVKPMPDTFGFLYIGRLIRDKGIYEYLEACRLVKAKHPEVRCLLVGPFDSNPSALKPEELEPFIEDGTIEYFGEQEDVRPYLEQCNVFVLPSYREGTPKTNLEAMSMGRAVITTDTTGCRETVIDGKNGYLVPVRDIITLSQKMIYMIEHSEEVPQMGKFGRMMVEKKFDVTLVNQKICKVMQL